MMPEAMATFINEEDVPPDKENPLKLDLSYYNEDATSIATLGNTSDHKQNVSSKRLACDSNETKDLVVRRFIDASFTESSFDYSTNLADKTFGSYDEANLTSFSVNRERTNEEYLLYFGNNAVDNVENSQIIINQDYVNVGNKQITLNIPQDVCNKVEDLSANNVAKLPTEQNRRDTEESSRFKMNFTNQNDRSDINGGTKRSERLKVCKSNQTSFNDLSSLNMYYIDSDEEQPTCSNVADPTISTTEMNSDRYLNSVIENLPVNVDKGVKVTLDRNTRTSLNTPDAQRLPFKTMDTNSGAEDDAARYCNQIQNLENISLYNINREVLSKGPSDSNTHKYPKEQTGNINNDNIINQHTTFFGATSRICNTEVTNNQKNDHTASLKMNKAFSAGDKETKCFPHTNINPNRISLNGNGTNGLFCDGPPSDCEKEIDIRKFCYASDQIGKRGCGIGCDLSQAETSSRKKIFRKRQCRNEDNIECNIEENQQRVTSYSENLNRESSLIERELFDSGDETRSKKRCINAQNKSLIGLSSQENIEAIKPCSIEIYEFNNNIETGSGVGMLMEEYLNENINGIKEKIAEDVMENSDSSKRETDNGDKHIKNTINCADSKTGLNMTMYQQATSNSNVVDRRYEVNEDVVGVSIIDSNNKIKHLNKTDQKMYNVGSGDAIKCLDNHRSNRIQDLTPGLSFYEKEHGQVLCDNLICTCDTETSREEFKDQKIGEASQRCGESNSSKMSLNLGDEITDLYDYRCDRIQDKARSNQNATYFDVKNDEGKVFEDTECITSSNVTNHQQETISSKGVDEACPNENVACYTMKENEEKLYDEHVFSYINDKLTIKMSTHQQEMFSTMNAGNNHISKNNDTLCNIVNDNESKYLFRCKCDDVQDIIYEDNTLNCSHNKAKLIKECTTSSNVGNRQQETISGKDIDKTCSNVPCSTLNDKLNDFHSKTYTSNSNMDDRQQEIFSSMDVGNNHMTENNENKYLFKCKCEDVPDIICSNENGYYGYNKTKEFLDHTDNKKKELVKYGASLHMSSEQQKVIDANVKYENEALTDSNVRLGRTHNDSKMKCWVESTMQNRTCSNENAANFSLTLDDKSFYDGPTFVHNKHKLIERIVKPDESRSGKIEDKTCLNQNADSDEIAYGRSIFDFNGEKEDNMEKLIRDVSQKTNETNENNCQQQMCKVGEDNRNNVGINFCSNPDKISSDMSDYQQTGFGKNKSTISDRNIEEVIEDVSEKTNEEHSTSLNRCGGEQGVCKAIEDDRSNIGVRSSATVEFKDASTETVPNLTYRLRKCISDPIRGELRSESAEYKSRNSFHKDLNEALSSLLWQPYEYQNMGSTDEEDSSCSCSDLEAPNNGKEAGCTVNNLLLRAGHKLEGRDWSRDEPLSSRTRLSATNSFSVCCAEDACVKCSDCDAIFSIADAMTETSGAVEAVVQSGEAPNQTQNALRNLSQVNIVGLPNQPRPHNSRNNTLTTGQFKYNANVNSANIVNLSHHQRHHSQIENSQNLPINHIRSLSVPKKLENGTLNHGEVSEQRRFPINVSNVNVNYYRAVPANVVSAVPQIQCVTSNDCVSNVNIVQAMPVGSNNYNFQNLQGLQQCAVTTFGSSIITQHFPSGNTYNVTSTPVQVQTSPPNSIGNQNLFNNTVNSTSTSTNSNILANNNNTGLTTEVTIHNVGLQNATNSQSNNQQIQIINRPNEVTRTFTSTEAQTDDTLGAQIIQNSSEIQIQTTANSNQNREQRRRERRERRHHRRLNNGNHANNGGSNTNTNSNNNSSSNQQQPFLQQPSQIQNDRLPDLLNSHLPPSYNNTVVHQNVLGNPLVNTSIVNAPLVQTMVPNPIVGSPMVSFPAPVVAGQVPLVQSGPVPVQVAAPTGFRFPFQGTGFRRSRYSEDSPKSCCGLLSMKPGSLRWFIALIAFVAVCCVLVGTVLGAMRTSGRDHLTVSLLMIGVGIVLITVSGIAWKLTSHDSSTCRSMLGLGSTESVDVCARRFVPRLPPSYGRPHHPYAAMMYPEFQYRPPPPSYQASMQEYRLRLLLLDRGHTPQIQAGIQNAVSPPPTYRSHAGSLLRAPLTSRRDAQSEYSCPPSYRSQTSSTRPNNALPAPSVLHSREQSLSLSESNNESVNVVLHNAEDDIALDNITLDSLKMEPETELNPLKMLLKGSTSDLEGTKDGNLVTIVQTSDQSPVIVTVSGSSNTENMNLQTPDIQSEMQILAHL